jgi:hypothetical protein
MNGRNVEALDWNAKRDLPSRQLDAPARAGVTVHREINRWIGG